MELFRRATSETNAIEMTGSCGSRQRLLGPAPPSADSWRRTWSSVDAQAADLGLQECRRRTKAAVLILILIGG